MKKMKKLICVIAICSMFCAGFSGVVKASDAEVQSGEQLCSPETTAEVMEETSVMSEENYKIETVITGNGKGDVSVKVQGKEASEVPPLGVINVTAVPEKGSRLASVKANGYEMMKAPSPIFLQVTASERFVTDGKIKITVEFVVDNTVTTETGLKFDKETGCIIEYENTSIKTLEIPEEIEGVKVTSIGKSAFNPRGMGISGEKVLEEIIVPGTVTSIGDEAFAYLVSLKKIILNEGLREIGDSAFIYTGLTQITFPETTETIGSSALALTSIKSVLIPKNVKSYNVFVSSSKSGIEEIKVDPDNKVYSSKDGVLYSKDGKKLIACPKRTKSFAVPEGVEEVNLTGTGFEEISLPKSVKKASGIAWRTYQLKKITVDSGNPYLCSQNGVLYNKDKTELIGLPAQIAASGTWYIPEGVKKIAAYCIGTSGKKMNLVIPRSVTYISAFFASESNLSILYLGSESNWNTVVKEKDWDPSMNYSIRYIQGSQWLSLGDKWYYAKDGKMVTGWQKSGKSWYYLKKDGSMATGWQKVGKNWYYLKKDGSMATGWQKIGSSWYYLTKDGAMVTGWKKVGKAWYYFGADGNMITGWKKIGKSWYYFNANGTMTTGWKQIGGRGYWFNSGGVWVR